MDKSVPKPKLVLGNIMGPEGNAFVILGRAQEVAKRYNDFAKEANASGNTALMRRHPMDWEAIRKEAESGDYEHLLDTLEKHFNVVATGGRYA